VVRPALALLRAELVRQARAPRVARVAQGRLPPMAAPVRRARAPQVARVAPGRLPPVQLAKVLAR